MLARVFTALALLTLIAASPVPVAEPVADPDPEPYFIPCCRTFAGHTICEC